MAVLFTAADDEYISGGVPLTDLSAPPSLVFYLPMVR